MSVFSFISIKNFELREKHNFKKHLYDFLQYQLYCSTKWHFLIKGQPRVLHSLGIFLIISLTYIEYNLCMKTSKKYKMLTLFPKCDLIVIYGQILEEHFHPSV